MMKRHSGLPFDDIRDLIQNLPASNDEMAAHTLNQLPDETGYVADLCVWYSRWSGRSPEIHRPLLTLFAGTHKVEQNLLEENVDEWLLKEITAISEGSAVVNRLCQSTDMGLKLFDLALQLPVADIRYEAALDEKACAGTIGFGMEAIAGGTDALCISAIEQTPSISTLAILAALTGREVIDDISDAKKNDAVETAISTVEGYESNSLEVLRRLGGRELAAICGAILAARTQHIPSVIDGPSALTACVLLHRENADSIKHCIMAQPLENPRFNQIADQIGLDMIFKQRVSKAPGGGLTMASEFLKLAFKHKS